MPWDKIYLWTGSLPSQLSWLVNRFLESACLRPQCCIAIVWVLRIGTHVCVLIEQVLFPLSHLSSLVDFNAWWCEGINYMWGLHMSFFWQICRKSLLLTITIQRDFSAAKNTWNIFPAWNVHLGGGLSTLLVLTEEEVSPFWEVRRFSISSKESTS